MVTIFWLVFWGGLALLTVAAGVTMHAKRRDAFGAPVPFVDDEIVEQILERGEVFVEEDDPLDLDEIDDEEERFWSESWDEPTGDW